MIEPLYDVSGIRLYCEDAGVVLAGLPSESVQCVVTSPPYWGLRDYKCPGQIGLEASPDEYISTMLWVFLEVRRILKPDGTLWLNMGDCYASGKGTCYNTGSGHNSLTSQKGRQEEEVYPTNRGNKSALERVGLKPKDLVGMPWRLAFALQAQGWWLRSDIIWHKPNPMPESVQDRPTKSHEYLFLLAKSEDYYYNGEAIMEPCESGPSDVKKMVEQLPRLGGKTLTDEDPLHAGSAMSKIGRTRGVGGSRKPSGWASEEQRDQPFLGRFEHPKAHGKNSRMNQDRDPAHGEERHDKDPVGGRVRNSGNLKRKTAGEHDDSRVNTHMGYSFPWEGTLYRNRRTVWTIATEPYEEAHFATFPEKLVAPCILAGSRIEDVVLDPFCGAGTTLFVAKQFNRRAIGIDLNPAYCELAVKRLAQEVLPLEDAAL